MNAEIIKKLKINTFCQDVYDRTNSPFSGQQYFVLNELDGQGRGNKNVACFKNLLVEIDQGTLSSQLSFLKYTIPIRPTLLTYSGGKSLHAIFSLARPLDSLEEYKDWVKALYSRVGPGIDTACSNPARLTRTPGVRRDNGQLQTLVAEGPEVANEEMWDFIRKHFPKKVIRLDKAKTGEVILSKKSKKFLESGSLEGFGGRNDAVYKVAYALAAQGADISPAINKGSELGLPEWELARIIDNIKGAI
jgi:hypothetical protein